MSSDFQFSSFRLCTLCLTGIKIGSKWHLFKHAEMQSETQGVQSFGAKSVASVAKAQQFKNQFESPDSLLSN